MGKYPSLDQCRLIAENFDRCIYLKQNCEVCETQGIPKLIANMSQFPSVRLEVPELPAEFKDVGDMSPEQGMQFREDCLKGKI